MKNIPNAEKSIFFPKNYVIYDGDGRAWWAQKIHDGSWSARPGPSHPDRALMHSTADTLTALAAKVGARKKVPVVANV